MLKDSYREVMNWFSDYDSARSNAEKQELASKFCCSLRVHLGADHDHSITRRLIDQIMQSSPIDEQFDSKVRILRDLIAQFANEEAFV